MITKKQEIAERLQREFDVCDKHILRINEALEELGVDLPMPADCYASLNKGQIRCKEYIAGTQSSNIIMINYD